MDRLFNPFRYIAGTKSLVLGLIFMVSAVFLLYSAGMIQDGYLHIAPTDAAIWSILLMQLLWWIVPALFYYVGGLLLSRSHIRIVDVLGTTAFAQLLLIPMIAPMLLPAVKNGMNTILQALQQGVQPAMGDMMAVMISGIVSTLFIVLFFIWNYNAFATSCNVRGWKAVLYFVVVQLVVTFVGVLV